MADILQTFRDAFQFVAVLGTDVFFKIAAFLGLNTELMHVYGLRFLSGIPVTIKIVGFSMLFGAVIALPTAFARMSRSPVLRTLSLGYVYFFRGTPLLAQAFLLYHGLGIAMGIYRPVFEDLGIWWILREGYYYVIFAFALNTGAYQAEILRGAIESVPRGQMEAGLALGLPKRLVFRKIIWPQALVLALRPLGNELILMIKASAVASLLTVYDLMGETRFIFSQGFNFEVYLWAAFVYLLMVETIRRLWDMWERRMTRHLRPAPVVLAETAK